MDFIIAIIFGAVQGLTEFIPVSSSGHLLLLHEVFPSLGVDELAFDVALHIGTLIALFIFFWLDYWRYLRAGWDTFSKTGRRLARMRPKPATAVRSTEADRRLSVLILVAIIPAGIAGLLLEDIIDAWLRSPWVVVCTLALVAVLFILIEVQQRVPLQKEITRINWQNALWIGIAQALALIPGVSRSGITMVAGMSVGMKREHAARFSFLISMPLIAGAGLKKGIDLAIVGVDTNGIAILIVGILSAAIVGYLVIGWLLNYLTHRSLVPFALYRVALALVVAFILL
jgi:undecaprenyl-diphosphatase